MVTITTTYECELPVQEDPCWNELDGELDGFDADYLYEETGVSLVVKGETFQAAMRFAQAADAALRKVVSHTGAKEERDRKLKKLAFEKMGRAEAEALGVLEEWKKAKTK